MSNLLGAVYGSNDPDGPSTPHEPSAAERAQMPAAAPRIDDDLAAALNAALVAPTSEQSVAAPAPVAQPPAPAFATASAAPAPTTYAPSYNTAMAAWAHGDDDIFPSALGKSR